MFWISGEGSIMLAGVMFKFGSGIDVGLGSTCYDRGWRDYYKFWAWSLWMNRTSKDA